jgi:hypothetical protein
MTTIQYFPRLRDYTKKVSISRNGVRKNIADFIYEWKSDDDPEEYFELYDGDGYYRLNYKIITYLLIYHQPLFLNRVSKDELLDFILQEHIFYNPTDTVKEYKQYIEDNKLDLYIFIQEQFKNIQILSNSLISETKLPTLNAVADTPRYSKYGKNKEKLVLFRGFNYPRYKKMLRDIYIGKVITTVSMLSTTVQEIIAINYAFDHDRDVHKQIVWKIIIERKMFDIFNYTFVSEPFDIDDSLETLFIDNNIECEFLLNMGALLECVAINIINDFPGRKIPGYDIKPKEYTEYTFKFLGWDYDYIDVINKNMSKYIEYLK